jgi:hypothetical protein
MISFGNKVPRLPTELYLYIILIRRGRAPRGARERVIVHVKRLNIRELRRGFAEGDVISSLWPKELASICKAIKIGGIRQQLGIGTEKLVICNATGYSR